MGLDNKKESYYRDTIDDMDSEDSLLEDPLSFWQQEKRSLWKKIMSRSETPFLIMGVGLLLMVVVFFAIAPESGSGDIAGRFNVLSERLDQVEKKIGDMEIRFERLAQIENKIELLNKSVLRFDSADASATLRMNRIANDLGSVQEELSLLKNKAPVASPITTEIKEVGETSETPQATYHIVQPGETLYRISRQHNVTVDTIRRLNDLTEQVSIYPGQKLKINTNGD